MASPSLRASSFFSASCAGRLTDTASSSSSSRSESPQLLSPKEGASGHACSANPPHTVHSFR